MRYRFSTSLRFEPFFALNVLLDPQARIHPGWRTQTLARLPKSFQSTIAATGAAAEIWAMLPGVLPQTLAVPSFEELLGALRRLPIERFSEELLWGVLHSRRIVRALLRGELTLRAALGKLPRQRRDWLGYMSLYPYDRTTPVILALENLLKDPQGLRSALLELLETFWRRAFATTWEHLQSQLESSRAEKERLFASCSLSEFFERALIRANIDEARGLIGAVRGGYRVELARLAEVHFFPSAFNDRRYWSVLGERSPPLVAFFPYFDPALTPEAVRLVGAARAPARAALDPALILKALGEGTRFAIARLLAQGPRTSVELARALAVSKPTISHHVSLMRQAGLLRESYENGAVRLTLEREVLANLSALLIGKLYDRSEHEVSRARARR